MPDNTTVPKVPIGCRYPVDRIDLLDAIGKRLRFPDRAANIRAALDFWIEKHLPGALGESTDRAGGES